MSDEIKSVKPSYLETSGLPFLELLPLALREGNSRKPIYQMHKWWARRLSTVFRAILIGSVLSEDNSDQDFMDYFHEEREPGKGMVVYDPFTGGGTTLVEAQRLGFELSGSEIDPVAWYVTRQELSYVSPDALDSAFEKVTRLAAPKVRSLYKTTLDDGQGADIVYGFWVYLIACPSCSVQIELHPHFQLYRDRNKQEQTVFCSSCHHIETISITSKDLRCTRSECSVTTEIRTGNISKQSILCPNCGTCWPRSIIRDRDRPLDQLLFAIEYLDKEKNGKPITRFRQATVSDHELFLSAEKESEKLDINYPWMEPFLQAEIPKDGRKDIRPINYGFRRYADLFNSRQLLSLAFIGDAIYSLPDQPERDLLLLALSDSLASNNMLCSYAFDYKKLTPLFGIHGYQVVTRPVENNVWGTLRGRGSFSSCYRKVKRGILSKSQISVTKNSTPSLALQPEHLESPQISKVEGFQRRDARTTLLSDNSVDIILTDPPYFDNLNYGELSDFFYQWLKPLLQARFSAEMEPPNTLNISESLTAAQNGRTTLQAFSNGLREVFVDCYRILKHSGLMIFTFHYKNGKAWGAVTQALRKSGFGVTAVSPVRSEGRSGFHSSPGNLRWDAVLVCRKKEWFSEPCDWPKFDFMEQLEKWHEILDGRDGEPSTADWMSLGMALQTANDVNQTRDYSAEEIHYSDDQRDICI